MKDPLHDRNHLLELLKVNLSMRSSSLAPLTSTLWKHLEERKRNQRAMTKLGCMAIGASTGRKTSS